MTVPALGSLSHDMDADRVLALRSSTRDDDRKGVSSLRSTTRDDDIDMDDREDGDELYTSNPAPASNTNNIFNTRLTRSVSKSMFRSSTHPSITSTTPSTTSNLKENDSGAQVSASLRRSRRKRGRSRSPPPTIADADADDDRHHSYSAPNASSTSTSVNHSGHGSRSRRSRSLSVIPPIALQAVTHPKSEDPAVRALGLSQSARPGSRALSFEPEQLIRMREGHFFRPRPERKTDIKRDWRRLSMSEAIWNGLEEAGHVAKGRAWTAREGYDEEGNLVKPELPYVMLTKLVIAASPRKMLTLNQIYQAMEERWPYFRTLGQTFRNSIRHNLSMNPAFVNVERPACENRLGNGKGGHWMVSDDTNASHRGRAKKKARFEAPKHLTHKAPASKMAPSSHHHYASHHVPHPAQMSPPPPPGTQKRIANGRHPTVIFSVGGRPLNMPMPMPPQPMPPQSMSIPQPMPMPMPMARPPPLPEHHTHSPGPGQNYVYPSPGYTGPSYPARPTPPQQVNHIPPGPPPVHQPALSARPTPGLAPAPVPPPEHCSHSAPGYGGSNHPLEQQTPPLHYHTYHRHPNIPYEFYEAQHHGGQMNPQWIPPPPPTSATAPHLPVQQQSQNPPQKQSGIDRNASAEPPIGTASRRSTESIVDQAASVYSGDASYELSPQRTKEMEYPKKLEQTSTNHPQSSGQPGTESVEKNPDSVSPSPGQLHPEAPPHNGSRPAVQPDRQLVERPHGSSPVSVSNVPVDQSPAQPNRRTNSKTTTNLSTQRSSATSPLDSPIPESWRDHLEADRVNLNPMVNRRRNPDGNTSINHDGVGAVDTNLQRQLLGEDMLNKMDKVNPPALTDSWRNPQLLTPPYDYDLGGGHDSPGMHTSPHRQPQGDSPPPFGLGSGSTLPPFQRKHVSNGVTLPGVASLLNPPLSPSSVTSGTPASTPTSNKTATLPSPRCI